MRKTSFSATITMNSSSVQQRYDFYIKHVSFSEENI